MIKLKRVLYTINNLQTAGMRYVVADLLRYLNRTRFQPAVAVGKVTGSWLEKEVSNICEVFEMPLHIPIKPLTKFIKTLKYTAKRLRDRADIVHSFDYSSDFVEGITVKLAGLPWIIEKTNFNWGGIKWRLRSTLASNIVCLSEIQRTKLFQNTCFYHKSKTIHTGVDLKRFYPATQDWKIKRRMDMNINPNAFIICCVADLVPVKGHKELLEAFADVQRTIKEEVLLLLVGHGEAGYEDELKYICRKLDITGSVLFLGRRDDVPEILKMSDGFILATRNWGRREAFGAAIVEAMACGLSVIATRSGGPEEIVIDGQTGWLVDPAGSTPLVLALMDMLQNKEKRTLFSQKSRERAEKHFPVEIMVRRYEDLYDAVLTNKAIGRSL